MQWDESGRRLLLARAIRLLEAPGRAVLGIAGAPGAGKSTISEWLLDALEDQEPGAAVCLPMDGYHLGQTVLERHGTAGRKGSPETFDADGYVDMVRAVRRTTDRTLYAPEFRRSIDDAVAGAIEIPASTRLVVTEGNYLLLDDHPWTALADLLDETWYVELDRIERLRRLEARHLAFDPDPARARDRARGSDERNARLVSTRRRRSTLVVHRTTSTAAGAADSPHADG